VHAIGGSQLHGYLVVGELEGSTLRNRGIAQGLATCGGFSTLE